MTINLRTAPNCKAVLYLDLPTIYNFLHVMYIQIHTEYRSGVVKVGPLGPHDKCQSLAFPSHMSDTGCQHTAWVPLGSTPSAARVLMTEEAWQCHGVQTGLYLVLFLEAATSYQNTWALSLFPLDSSSDEKWWKTVTGKHQGFQFGTFVLATIPSNRFVAVQSWTMHLA